MGPFDNEAGTYTPSPIHANGHWFQDPATCMLYIVPGDELGAEIEGPEDGVMDLLTDLYRGVTFSSVDPVIVAKQLKLEYVHDWQRRFDPKRGYFIA